MYPSPDIKGRIIFDIMDIAMITKLEFRLLGLAAIETSALDATNVDIAFHRILSDIYNVTAQFRAFLIFS